MRTTPNDLIVPKGFDTVITRPSINRHDAMRGLVEGVSYVGKFGYRNVNTAAAGDQTLWADNSNFVIMTSASTLTITYNNATDGAGTTGALSLLIDYLDENFLRVSNAVHVLGSSGSDTTAFSCLGINRVVVLSSGSSDSNVNDITFANGANTQALIPAGDSVTQQSPFHCPIRTLPVMENLIFTASKSGGAAPFIKYKAFSYSRVTQTRYKPREYELDTAAASQSGPHNPVIFSGRDVIFLTMDTSRDNTVNSFEYELFLYDTRS